MTQPIQQVGQYNFLRKIGTGRMAEVYLGRIEGAEGFQKPVAIKKILPELAGDNQFVQSLIAEAKVGGQLHHRNIVEVYDFIRYGTDYCIIMEYVDGVNLAGILKSAKRYRVRIPPAAALYVTHQICDGLDYAHSARGFSGEPLNIIHRDLKPSNILISIKGGVKISDFGIARVMDQAIMRLSEGTARASYQYASPEQVTQSVRITAASDIFSVGSILFEMLTLEPLFSGKNALEALQSLRDTELNRRLALAQRQLPGSEKILMNALQPNPSDRYTSAAAMADAIRNLLTNLKEEEPRDRLTAYIHRLVRIVQEQGKRPVEDPGNEEDWEADTRVGNNADIEPAGSPSARANPPYEEPAGSNGWSSSLELSPSSAGMPPLDSEKTDDPAYPLASSYVPEGYGGPEIPPGYGGESTSPGGDVPVVYGTANRDEATAAPAWTPRGSDTLVGSFATIPPEPEIPRYQPEPSDRTRLGEYSTVENGYAASPMMPPPTMPRAVIDSTRILPTDIPPPPVPGYSALETTSQLPLPNRAFDATSQLLVAPPAKAQGRPAARPADAKKAVKKAARSKGPLMVLALVLLALLGGGSAWLLKQANTSRGAASGNEHTHQVGGELITCPTCDRQIACAPFCPFCGTPLSCQSPAATADLKCANCGEVNEKDSKFCWSCGKPLTSAPANSPSP